MPKVDMDMTTGTFAVWHVAEGEPVAKGAPLFDIETDKSAMEVEAPASGRLRHIRAQPGERIDVGAPVAWIYAEGEAVSLLMKFLFPYEQVRRANKLLSGGERTRLQLLLLMLQQPNLLVFDEPTNHLDIDSVEALEAAL